MKCFSTFSRIMQKILMNHSNKDFFDDLFYNATNFLTKEDEDDPILKIDRSLKSKYIRGERPITPFIKKIPKNLETYSIANWLDEEYGDIFTNEDDIEKIYKKFEKEDMPLDKGSDITVAIEILFRDILINHSDALPNKKIYNIETDISDNFNHDNKLINKQLINTKKNILKSKNKNIPKKYKNDFEFVFDNNDNIIWTNKTDDAYEKFPLSFNLKFDASENIKSFRDALNEANMSGKYVALGSAKEVSEFLGGDPHPFPEIRNDNIKNIKWYIGKENNPKELIIGVSIDI